MITTLTRQPLRYGLLALLAFAPLVDGGASFGPATIVRLGALALAVGWLLVTQVGPAGRRDPTPLDLPVVLFMALAAISAASSPDRYQSLQGFLALASGALVFAVATDVGREGAGRTSIMITFAAAGAAQAAAALAQRAWTGEVRPAGTYLNPNHLAMTLAMTGAVLLALEPRSRAARWARGGAFVLVGAGLLVTGSRGGALAACAGWGLVGWSRWRWRVPALAAALAVALVVIPNPLADRVKAVDRDDPYAYTRLQIWRSAIDRGLDHPLAGVGLNLFRQSSQRYAFPVDGGVARYQRRAESAHNDYLKLFAELGFPGLVLALWALLALARRGWEALRRPEPPEDRPLLLGAAGALAAAATQALVDTPLQVPGIFLPAAALAGLLASGARSAPVSADVVAAVAGGPRPALRRAAVLVMGLLAAAGVARHGLAHLAYQRAVSERAAGRPLAGLHWLGWAERLAPDSARYSDARAAAALVAWRASQDPALVEAAERAMIRAIALDPEDALRRFRLAQVYREIMPLDPQLRRAALERAKVLYEEAERLDPYGAAYPFERADVLVLLGDREGAVAALERAVTLEPAYLPARLKLARLRASRGERLAAAAQYAAIEAALVAYRQRPADLHAAAFLAVDRAAVRREAAALAEGAS